MQGFVAQILQLFLCFLLLIVIDRSGCNFSASSKSHMIRKNFS